MTTLEARLPIANAIGFFVFWLLVLYAGADHPPPRGFIFVVMLVLLCALVVYWRLPYYLRWMVSQRPMRRLIVVGDGFLAGGIISLVSMAITLMVRSELTTVPRAVDYFIWFAVLGVMGMLNSTAIYFVNWLILRTFARSAFDNRQPNTTSA